MPQLLFFPSYDKRQKGICDWADKPVGPELDSQHSRKTHYTALLFLVSS
jgi:hypothetical protein